MSFPMGRTKKIEPRFPEQIQSIKQAIRFAGWLCCMRVQSPKGKTKLLPALLRVTADGGERFGGDIMLHAASIRKRGLLRNAEPH